MESRLIKHLPGEVLGYRKNGQPIYTIAGGAIDTVSAPASLNVSPVIEGAANVLTNLAASVDGAQVVLPVAGCQRTFVGIALKTIPNNGVGVVRAYGLHNSVAIFATGTSATVAQDELLGVGVAGSLGVNSTGLIGTRPGGFVVALAAIGAAINSPGGYTKGFVRAL